MPPFFDSIREWREKKIKNKKSGPKKYLNLEPDIKQKDEMIVHWSDR